MKATFEEEKQKPLMIEIESARRMIITTVNKSRQEYGIPVFILEGIIADIHQQLSSESKIVLLNDVDDYLDDIKADKNKEIKRLKKELEENNTNVKNNDVVLLDEE